MGLKTPLYDSHKQAGAKIVDFGGWDMPIHYGSQLDEHHVVRRGAGMFDVSHMTIVDVQGEHAKAFLQKVLANDVDKLQSPGKALYSGMLNETGGVLDDLIVYLMEDGYRLVVNCATREKDLAWLALQAKSFRVTLQERSHLAMLAVQGPDAIAAVQQVKSNVAELISGLKVFSAALAEDWMYCRTGYTGEDGLEIILPNEAADGFWHALLDQGVKPCGLGARDTLRLEAGMNLYGADMDERVSPLESNMAWTVAFEPAGRDFIGRTALEQQQQRGLDYKLVGLVLEQRGVLRAHQKVVKVDSEESGEITSGTYSPSLNLSLALARVPANWEGDCLVVMRGKQLPVRIVQPPFVRKGKKVFD